MVRLLTAITFLFLISNCSFASPQVERITKSGEFSGEGIVEDIQPGRITIRASNGKQRSFLIQNKGERYVSLDGNEYIVPMPCKIETWGTMPGKLLERGMVVEFSGEMNRAGRTGDSITQLKVHDPEATELKLEPTGEGPTGPRMAPCDVIGNIQQFVNSTMYLAVPKTKYTPTERIKFRVADEAIFDIKSNDLNRVYPGDKVVEFRGDKMSNGAMVIRDIKIELTAEREVATPSFSDQLYMKYSKLSDEPTEAREERSTHFVLYTDISKRASKVLLAKLETMYGFLARYYRKKPKEPIICYVVSDLDKFSGLDQVGVQKIQERAGVTVSSGSVLSNRNSGRVIRKMIKSVVYSCDDQDVVQHEAVHAFCSMAFGSAGPTWYAEGMAEMGQYWAPDQKEIQVEPVVIEYLTTAPKKDMMKIVAAGQITGDSWQAYSWRWALCHLLANNPTYSKRFLELGRNLMAEEDDSFEKAFGKIKDHIAFEYDQFVKNFGNGYRADLCAWQWVEKPRDVRTKTLNFTVNAQYGWQATAITLKSGSTYDFLCKKGENWKIKKSGEDLPPDGNARGNGKLIGAIFNDFELSEPFEIGSKLQGFKPETSGLLYVRCQDKWTSIADNQGEIKCYVRKSPAKKGG